MGQSYTIGGDSLQNIGHQYYAAQSFTPQVTHDLNCIDINLRTYDQLRTPTIWVYLADVNHKPTGDFLSKSIRHYADDWNLYNVFRMRSIMSPTLLSEGIEYVIVIHAFALLTPWHMQWEFDNGDATYPRGIRLNSNDEGATWDPHPGDDHMFAEFGTAPIPEPPPDPPTTKWLIVSITQTLTATGYRIVVTTNVPCHLWLRWTTVEPKEHLIQRTKRGLPLMLEKYFCFDVYEDNEQEEASDTLIHTFIKEPWPVCETRYFYFQGEIAGAASKSTTAIFSKHRYAPPPAPITEYFYPDADPEVSSVDGYARRQVAASTWDSIVTGIGTHAWDGNFNNSVHIYAWGTPGQWYFCAQTLIVFDTRSIPVGATITEASLDIYIKLVRDFLSATPGIVVTPSTPASNTAIVPADYQTVTPELLSDIIPWGNFVFDEWETFPFNAAGLLAINPGGWTKLALRSHPYDVLNQIPPWVAWQQTELQFRSADTEFINRPKLTVTYLP